MGSRKAKLRKKLRQTLRERHELKRAAHDARKEYRRLWRAQRDQQLHQSPHYGRRQSPHFSQRQSPHYSQRQSPHFSQRQSPHHGQHEPDVKFTSIPTEAEWKEARNRAVQPKEKKEKTIPDVGKYLQEREDKARAARQKDGTAISAPNFVFNHDGKEIFATIVGGRNYKGKFQFQLFGIDRIDGEEHLIYDDLGWFDAAALLKATAGTPVAAWCADQVARNCKADSYPEGAHDKKRSDFVYVQSTWTKN